VSSKNNLFTAPENPECGLGVIGKSDGCRTSVIALASSVYR
jgi:hypothetical protein